MISYLKNRSFLKESEGKVQMDKLNNQQKENLENVLNSKTENAEKDEPVLPGDDLYPAAIID